MVSQPRYQPGDRNDRSKMYGDRADDRAPDWRDLGERCHEVELERAKIVDLSGDRYRTRRPGTE